MFPSHSPHLQLFKDHKTHVYLVTPDQVSNHDLFTGMHEAILAGVSMVQLRDKKASHQELFDRGMLLLEHLRPRGIPLIVNDHVELAYRLGADGVHLGQSDGSVERARDLLGPHAIIGLSIENETQAQAAQRLNVTYLSASPVFATRTKLDCSPPWELSRLRALCACSRLPVVAIGGIHAHNASLVMDCGVRAIAIISAFWSASDRYVAIQELLQTIHIEKRHDD